MDEKDHSPLSIIIPCLFLAIALLLFNGWEVISLSTPISNPFTLVTTGDNWFDCCWVSNVNSWEIRVWSISPSEQNWVILSRKLKNERTWVKISTNKDNIFDKEEFPFLSLLILLLKKVFTSWTLLIMDIGIPTPPMADGVGKFFNIW